MAQVSQFGGSVAEAKAKDTTLERKVLPTTLAAPTIPNGGLEAWLQVTGTFFIYFNTWGLLSSYGSFQAFYESELLKDYTRFQISTIGSLQSFLLVFLAFLVGPIYDIGYFRHLLAAGSGLIVLGTVTQSFCTEFWQLLLAQGLCFGLGAGCLSVLSVAIPSLWFTTRLPLANGVATAGSGVGGVIFPVVIRSLLSRVGFGWTVRAIALIIFTTLALSNILIRHRQSPGMQAGKHRALIDQASLHDRPYLLFVAGCFAVFLGLYTPFFYITSYSTSTGVMSNDLAFYVLAAMNLSSVFGRIIPSLFVQSVGPLNMISATTIVLGVAALCLLAVKTLVGVFVTSIVYGFFTGTFFALQPTVFVKLAADPRFIGTRFGMAFSVLSVALLLGSPIAGALQRAYGYDAGWIWAGVLVLAGAVIILSARIVCVGASLRKVV